MQPQFTDEHRIDIRQGRHPVIEQVQEGPFTANDARLDTTRKMLIITGPNMGGKPTLQCARCGVITGSPIRQLRAGRVGHFGSA